jgi:hypothetical protein
VLSSWAASGRAKASVPPPAANGTMKVTGLSGHVWAWAWPATAETTATSANRARRTTLDFTAFSAGYRKRPPSAAQLLFASRFDVHSRRKGERPYRMQDARCDPLK